MKNNKRLVLEVSVSYYNGLNSLYFVGFIFKEIDIKVIFGEF